MLAEDWLLTRMAFLIPLILSLSVHEWAHAWSAWKLGDDTAEREGRLTLNPLAHMDPIGTLLLPLLGAPFGWAKPVPVNMGRFHRSVGLRSGIVLTVGAGPISNICLAFLSGALLLAAALVCGGIESVPRPLHAFLDTLLILNVALALFNLVPVPPLDGSRLLDCVVPDACRGAWEAFCRLGPLGLVLFFALLLWCGCEYLFWPLQATEQAVNTLVRYLTG